MIRAVLRRHGPHLGVLLAALGVSFTASIRQDYRAYSRQWSRVVARQDPWIDVDGRLTGNAYGPVNALLAFPHGIHPALPRVLFTLTYLGTCLWFLRRFGSIPLRRRSLAAVFLASGLFWVSVAEYGHNDVLAAAFALAAVALADRGWEAGAGLALALGVLTKLYPLALAPLLAFDGPRLRGRFFLGFLAALASGLGLAWWAWGESVLVPFGFALMRESSLLSVFYFLRGPHSPFPVPEGGPGLDWLSAPLVVASLVVLFAVHVAARLSAAFSSALGAVMLFALYKVSHFQFYVTPVFLLAYWFYAEAWREGERPPLLPALVTYAVWVSLVPVAFRQMGHFKGEWAAVREWIGLPSFAIQVWLIGSLVRWQLRASRLCGPRL